MFREKLFKAFILLSIISMVLTLTVIGISWNSAVLSKEEATAIAKSKLADDYLDLEFWEIETTNSHLLINFRNRSTSYQIWFRGTKIEVIEALVKPSPLPVSYSSMPNGGVFVRIHLPEDFDSLPFDSIQEWERLKIKYSLKSFDKFYEINAKTGEIREIGACETIWNFYGCSQSKDV